MDSVFGIFSGGTPKSFWSNLLFFDWTLAEFLTVILLLYVTFRTRKETRILGYFFFAVIASIYVAQLIALYMGGEFLSRLAVENITHTSFLTGAWTPVVPVLVIMFWVGFSVLIERFSDSSPRSVSRGGAMTVLLLAIACNQLGKHLPKEVVSERDGRFHKLGMLHTSPLLSFARILMPVTPSVDKLKPEYLAEVQNFGFQVNQESRFPFIRKEIYSSPPPLPNFTQTQLDRPNVILLFIEGMSLRSIESTETRHPGLTPNLLAFLKQNVWIRNYWSHTAASYRGMKGQLCSMFPLVDGVPAAKDATQPEQDMHYHCLPEIFHEAGYSSVFLNAHTRDDSFLDEIMPKLGFEAVMNAEEALNEYLPNQNTSLSRALSDQQFFASMRGFLQARSKRVDSKPFFMSAYNIGTHAFIDVPGDGVKYRKGDNLSLNTIHNFDQAFGAFMQYFAASEFAKNTIIVVTTDHSHYPEPSFIDAFDEPNFTKFFIDQVPLGLYIPGANEAQLDARHASSIHLAPTIAHLLGLPNGPTSWLGTSLFERERVKYSDLGVAWFHDNYYLIANGTTEFIGSSEDPDLKKAAIRTFLDFTAKIETEDRIWWPQLRRTHSGADKKAL